VSLNRLLVIDDEGDLAAFIAETATDMGFDAHAFSDPVKFRQMVDSFQPTVLVLDLQMPQVDGIELLRWLAEVGCDAHILIASGMDTRVVTTAEQLGLSLGLKMAGTMTKPMALDNLEIRLGKLKASERKITAEALGAAIEAGHLVVHYQPKAVSKGPGRWIVEGAEALVRWKHEEYGLLYPDSFLSLAEESGLIANLTDFVFRAAMEQARVWFANGLYMELAVNVSAQFLTDLEFPDRLLTLVKENNLDPSMLTLELTETTSIADPEVTMDILARLRVRNVKLCIDDFGTGFSSLTHLYQMPFNELKIDNSFIRDMQTNEDAKAMVEALIYLAHKLKISVCAEGVENEHALQMLEAMHCDAAQGYLIGDGVNAKQLEQLVENWNSRFRTEAVAS